MRKNLFYVAAMAAMLASCTSEVIPERQVEEVKYPVQFSGAPGLMTRATGAEAAGLLSHQFNVFGTKWVNNAPIEVFNDTKVSYANSVWDYTSNTEETRYWDPNASKYTFFAYSDANATKVVVPPTTGDISNASLTIGSATQNVTLDQLQKVYVAKGKKVESNAFTSPVHFEFQNAAAKVRIAFYNAIPGYDVIIDDFYTILDGQAGANKVATFHGTFYSSAAYNVDLEDANTGITSLLGTPTTTNKLSLGDMCADIILARSITTPTFDKTDGEYTWAMPTNDEGGDITLKIDYRLKSKHEIINRTSTVVIPAAFNKWYANHAYTYFFKITDNDLHPITFSAEVVDFKTNETITTMDAEQQADITTYAEGSDVQNNNQYKVGDLIHVGIANAGTNPTVDVAFTTDDDIDGSNATTKISEDDYTNLTPINGGQYDKCYSFNATAANGAGYYVIRVKYSCDKPITTDHPSQSHVAYKVVRVVQ